MPTLVPWKLASAVRPAAPGRYQQRSAVGGCAAPWRRAGLDEHAADGVRRAGAGRADAHQAAVLEGRAKGPAVAATWPSMMPLLTTVVPTAVGPVCSANAPGAAVMMPPLSNVPNRPFICTAALPAPCALMMPRFWITP